MITEERLSRANVSVLSRPPKYVGGRRGLTGLDGALQDGAELLHELDFVIHGFLAHMRVNYKRIRAKVNMVKSWARDCVRTEDLVGLTEAKGRGVESHELAVRLGSLLSHGGWTDEHRGKGSREI